MRALPVPDVVRYHSLWTTTGGGFRMVQDGPHVDIEGGVGRAFAPHAVYDVRFETGSRTITVTTPAATDQLHGTGSRLLDPTWTGAYDILRYGLHGEPAAPPAPAPAASSDTSATPAQTSTIASVVAVSPAFYHVTDAGNAPCSNGDPGRVLALRPLANSRAHPLTQVTIDTSNGLFCAMHFTLNEPGALGVTGDYAISFAPAATYWLVSGGIADISARVFGIAAKHVVLRWEFSAFTTGA